MKITTFKITNLQGEDVNKAVSLLRGALQRLVSICRYDKNNIEHYEFFADMYKTLLKRFQTTSVHQFNEIFAQYDRQQELAMLTSALTGTPITLDHEVIFRLATTKYIELLKMDEWSGISTTGSESVFITTTGQKFKCFNCDKDGHRLQNCTLPVNQEKVAKN